MWKQIPYTGQVQREQYKNNKKDVNGDRIFIKCVGPIDTTWCIDHQFDY